MSSCRREKEEEEGGERREEERGGRRREERKGVEREEGEEGEEEKERQVTLTANRTGNPVPTATRI